MKNVLFLNPPHVACSVHAMGLNLWRILQQSKQFYYRYLIPESLEHLAYEMELLGADVILNNHMWPTLPWLTPELIQETRAWGVKQIAVCSHGLRFAHPRFDAYLIPDPRTTRADNIWPMGRPLPAVTTQTTLATRVPTIGTAGFLLPHKNFPGTVARIIREFDRAHIRLFIGQADLAPSSLNDAAECRRLVAECGKDIQLTLSTGYLSPPGLVDWLAQNDLNVYFYAGNSGAPAPAMAPDSALAALRPIAVNRLDPGLSLFWDLKPSVCIEDNSLKTIMENGITPLAPLYERFSDQRVLEDVENCIASLC